MVDSKKIFSFQTNLGFQPSFKIKMIPKPKENLVNNK